MKMTWKIEGDEGKVLSQGCEETKTKLCARSAYRALVYLAIRQLVEEAPACACPPSTEESRQRAKKILQKIVVLLERLNGRGDDNEEVDLDSFLDDDDDDATTSTDDGKKQE